ncbi:zinc-dependent peptidase [Ekhidna sp.]|uniref:zinc-dependent peptidase n=1 Tax=Ekhidna sp. TaxID=2608089 RepID=UPI003CCBA68F
MEVFLLLLIPLIARFVNRYHKTGSVFPAFFLNAKHKAFLQTNFEFYQKLPPKSKKIFERRVALFISSKKFIPRQMEHITWEMKVLISASAIQLTFGFPKVNLSWFRYILVYPESFYSQTNKQQHKGEVNPRAKSIVLSWKDFVEGYLEPDGRNLGLHEMAHALRLENRIMNEDYNFLNHEILEEWEARAKHTMKEIKDGVETFFRKYGATNNEEFFAVAVENFFERPIEFNSKHPKTYRTLCRLLRQDPLLLENA